MHSLKSTLAAAAAIGGLAFAGSAQAATTVSIGNVQATWQNATGGSGVVYANHGNGNAEVRWGTPSNNSNSKSGYDFAVAGTGDFTIDVEAPYDSGNFVIGDLTHHNYVIASGTGISGVQLILTADVTVGAVTSTLSYNFSYDFTHWETPNSTPCPVGAPAQNHTPCADQVTMNFTSLTNSFLVDGVRYTVDLAGFVDGHDLSHPVREFITPENKSTTAHVVARVSAVPEPASWAMLIVGFGLVGIAARRRKSPAIRSHPRWLRPSVPGWHDNCSDIHAQIGNCAIGKVGTMLKFVLGGVAAAALTVPAMAGVVVSIEAPGVANTTQTGFTEIGVETFDNRAPGTGLSFTSDFGGTSSFSGDYTNVQVWDNGSWGGVDNTNYAVALGTGTSYTIQLNQTANYFGYYQLALSGGNNDIEFYNGSTLVAALGYNDILSYMTPGHYGSPYSGQTQSEYFGFLNFNFTNGDRYDRVVFSNTGSDGFESDNHTIGNTVPEPATWAMLIVGFGLVGFASRRRRRVAQAAA